MSKCADLFKARLDEKKIKYTYFEATGEQNETIKISTRGKNAESISLHFAFGGDGCSVCIFSLGIVRTPEGKLAEMLALLNQLNREYRWGKFYLDKDNDVTCQGDAILCEANAAEECFELLVRFISIIDEVYPKLMKVIWG